jgi:hypothetical protein
MATRSPGLYERLHPFDNSTVDPEVKSESITADQQPR